MYLNNVITRSSSASSSLSDTPLPPPRSCHVDEYMWVGRYAYVCINVCMYICSLSDTPLPPPRSCHVDEYMWVGRYAYVCINVCMYVCRYVCMYVYPTPSRHHEAAMCMCMCELVCRCTCTYIYVCVCVCLCVYVCTYVYMLLVRYVCWLIYVSLYIFLTCLHTHTDIQNPPIHRLSETEWESALMLPNMSWSLKFPCLPRTKIPKWFCRMNVCKVLRERYTTRAQVTILVLRLGKK